MNMNINININYSNTKMWTINQLIYRQHINNVKLNRIQYFIKKGYIQYLSSELNFLIDDNELINIEINNRQK